MTNFEQVSQDIWTKMHQFREDSSKQMFSGNKAAGERARKVSNDRTKLMKQWRALSTGREPVTE